MSNIFDADYSSVETSLAPPLSPESIASSSPNNSESHTATTTQNLLHPNQQQQQQQHNSNQQNNIIDNDLSFLFTLKHSLEQKLRSIKDFTKAVIYSDDGTIIVSTFDVKPKEILDTLTIFDDFDAAFENGFDLDGDHYDVHRFYDKYIYGRKGEGGLTGVGFAIARTRRKNGRYIFVLITYGFPTISAKAVSTLGKFLNENLSNL